MRDIHQYVIFFFEQQLTSYSPILGDSSLLETIPSMATLYQNDMLATIPSFEEVKEAIFTINPDSAPSLDGITANFFHLCWDIVCIDIFNYVVIFFKGENRLWI